MTQEENAKVYTELINRLEDVKNAIKKQNYGIAMDILYKPYPQFQAITHSELKESKESKDGRIRKALIKYFTLSDEYAYDEVCGVSYRDIVAWLEKQGNINKTINMDEFAQGVLKGAAINLITWIDYNASEGKMCLSNGECKNIDDAFALGDWDMIFRYTEKYIKK